MIAPISVRVVLYRHGRLIRLDSNSTVTSSHEWAFDSDRSHWICFFRCLTDPPPHAAEPPSRKPTGCADCTRWVPTLPRGRAGSVARAAGGTTFVCCTLSARDSPRPRVCVGVSALGAALLPLRASGLSGTVTHASGGTTIVCCTLSARDSPSSLGSVPRGSAGSVAHAAGGTTIVCCTLSAHDSPRSRGCFVVSALGAALLPIPVFTSTRNIKPEGLTKILGAFGNAVLVRLARGDATCPSP